MKNKKIKVIIILAIVLIIIGVIVGIINTIFVKNKYYNLSEIAFLKDINTNKEFKVLNDEVNPELAGTYAFITSKNYDETVDIIALKTNNSTFKIATMNSKFENGIQNLFYSNGKIYYNDYNNYIWSIDLNEGNGIYNLKKYNFLDGYVNNNTWFNVINNRIYYFNQYALNSCDLITEECEQQIVDVKQKSDIIINNKIIDVTFNNVYVENNRYIYFMSKDRSDIYKLDISNPSKKDEITLATYTKVDYISDDAYLLSTNSILNSNGISFIYEYDNKSNFYIIKEDKKYLIKEKNKYIPITLLPNNYLMVAIENNDLLYYNIRYLNLKDGKIDNNYNLDFNIYASKLFIVTK